MAQIATWRATDYLLADLYDLQAVAGQVKDKGTGRPLPLYPRPQDAIEQRKRDEARAEALIAQRRRLEQRQAERTRQAAQENGEGVPGDG